MPSSPLPKRPQTSAQAKRAFAKRGGSLVSEAERRRLARAVELDRRAERIREREEKKKENKKKRTEKEEKVRETRKRMGREESPVKMEEGQMRLSGFVKRGGGEQKKEVECKVEIGPDGGDDTEEGQDAESPAKHAQDGHAGAGDLQVNRNIVKILERSSQTVVGEASHPLAKVETEGYKAKGDPRTSAADQDEWAIPSGQPTTVLAENHARLHSQKSQRSYDESEERVDGAAQEHREEEGIDEHQVTSIRSKEKEAPKGIKRPRFFVEDGDEDRGKEGSERHQASSIQAQENESSRGVKRRRVRVDDTNEHREEESSERHQTSRNEVTEKEASKGTKRRRFFIEGPNNQPSKRQCHTPSSNDQGRKSASKAHVSPVQNREVKSHNSTKHPRDQSEDQSPTKRLRITSDKPHATQRSPNSKALNEISSNARLMPPPTHDKNPNRTSFLVQASEDDFASFLASSTQIQRELQLPSPDPTRHTGYSLPPPPPFPPPQPESQVRQQAPVLAPTTPTFTKSELELFVDSISTQSFHPPSPQSQSISEFQPEAPIQDAVEPISPKCELELFLDSISTQGPKPEAPVAAATAPTFIKSELEVFLDRISTQELNDPDPGSDTNSNSSPPPESPGFGGVKRILSQETVKAAKDIKTASIPSSSGSKRILDSTEQAGPAEAYVSFTFDDFITIPDEEWIGLGL